MSTFRKKLDIRISDVESNQLVVWLLLFWGGLQFFLDHFHRILSILTESSAQAQLIATLFEQIG
jgi:hypothetical protein